MWPLGFFSQCHKYHHVMLYTFNEKYRAWLICCQACRHLHYRKGLWKSARILVSWVPVGSLESESDYSSQRFIERWGLHEPLSLGITTNGIRCAQWMGCENTGEKTKHGLPWWHGMLFSIIPCEVKIFGKDRGRLKRFLPQLRAAGLRSINLSRVPQVLKR